MITRRDFVTALSSLPFAKFLGLSAAAAAITPSASSALTSTPDSEDFTGYVKIAIGPGGHGHTYPGATVPFGMVQLSPDTYNDGWDWCSGYHYSDSSIMGFSHTHLSGTGGADLGDLLVMPGTGPPPDSPPYEPLNPGRFQSHFSHDNERAEPGYYRVVLDRYDVLAEL